MKVKYSKFEKIAGLFVLVAFVGTIVSFVGLAIKKGWFSPTVTFHTYISSAEGVVPGTIVQMSGLKVGTVTDAKLISQDKIKVNFTVFSEYGKQIGSNSHVMVFRPFLIGDKVLDIQSKGDSEDSLDPGSEIPYVASTDIMEILSGKKMGMALSSFEELTKSLKIIGEALADEKRAKNFIRVMDQLEPLVRNMNHMSIEVSKVTSVALRDQKFEEMMEQMPQLVENLSVLTEEFKKITPAISTVAPDLPNASLRALEALDEAVVLLKAMQKSFFLRGSVEDVREQEEKSRAPTRIK